MTSRLTPIALETATGKTKSLFDAVKSKLGVVPNMMRTMATSPAVLDGYLQLSGALGGGKLSAKTREQLALAIGQANECDYCLAAHSTIGKKVGLTQDEVRDARLGTSVDAGTEVLLRFARKLVDARGRVSDEDVQAVLDAGFDQGAVAEVVANVALNTFTNYFNHVAGTEVDFPVAPALLAHHRS